MLWKVLKKFGRTDKFINLIRSLHEDMKAQINFNGSLSDPFLVDSGVKQGDILAPTLFALYFAAVFLLAFANNTNGVHIRFRSTGGIFNIGKFRSKRKVISTFIRELLYADDCDLVTHTEQELQLANLLACR